jgi:hypothetical protein
VDGASAADPARLTPIRREARNARVIPSPTSSHTPTTSGKRLYGKVVPSMFFQIV